VDLRVVMMTFIRGIFKQMLTTFAKCKLQICNALSNSILAIFVNFAVTATCVIYSATIPSLFLRFVLILQK